MKNLYKYLIVILFLFFVFMNPINAKDEVPVNGKLNVIEGNCDDYFNIRTITYNESGANWAYVLARDDVRYGEGGYKSVWVDGGYSPFTDTAFETQTVSMVYYYDPKDGPVRDCAKLTVVVSQGDARACVAEISLYDSNYGKDIDRVKVSLNLDGKIQNGSYTGTISDYNPSSGTCDRQIGLPGDNIAIVSNEPGTMTGIVKSTTQCTNSEGKVVSCENIDPCTSISDIIRSYWKYVMIAIPIILMLLISLDFFKAMSSNDSDALKKSSSNAVKRVVITIIILALPVLITILFDWIGIRICL